MRTLLFKIASRIVARSNASVMHGSHDPSLRSNLHRLLGCMFNARARSSPVTLYLCRHARTSLPRTTTAHALGRQVQRVLIGDDMHTRAGTSDGGVEVLTALVVVRCAVHDIYHSLDFGAL